MVTDTIRRSRPRSPSRGSARPTLRSSVCRSPHAALTHTHSLSPPPPRHPWRLCAYSYSSPPRAGDFASLFQQPRDEEQDKLFNEGLRASNVWYGHESTVCWMQTELPPGIRFDAHIAQTYDESGWCFVEAAISAGLKVGKRRLDLAKRTDRAMGCAYGGSSWIPEAMLEGVCAAARPPPLLPDEVRRRLDEKKFTSKADVDVVDGLYRAFFDGAADSATQLNFSGLGWGEAEARQLKEVLPRFTRLKALDLSDNKLGATGASDIASLLKTMQISNLKRAAQPRTLPQWLRVLSAPIDTKANTFAFPSVSESEHVPFRTHAFLALARRTFPHSLANTHAHALPSPFLHIHAMPPSIVRRVDRGHVLLSDGWVARAPAPISPPVRPPRHSLRSNGLNDEAKRAVKDAAGSGVDIQF